MTTELFTPTHLALLLVVLLLVLGPRRLPATGRAIGTAMREFKQAITGRSRAPADPLAQNTDTTAGMGKPSGQEAEGRS